MDVLAISVADILVDGFGLGLDCTADEVQVNCTVQQTETCSAEDNTSAVEIAVGSNDMVDELVAVVEIVAVAETVAAVAVAVETAVGLNDVVDELVAFVEIAAAAEIVVAVAVAAAVEIAAGSREFAEDLGADIQLTGIPSV